MHIEQISQQVDDTRWAWSVWLEGSDDELDRVRAVTYFLHPTFAEPVVTRSDRTSKFRLDCTGWGTFAIKVAVHAKDGSTQWMRHRLSFERSARSVFVAAASADDEAVNRVKEAVKVLHLDVKSAQDIEPGEDLSSSLREEIDRAKAVILVNGKTPSRWVMQEVEIARSLGKPIINLGKSTFYDTKADTQVESLAELEGVIGSLGDKI